MKTKRTRLVEKHLHRQGWLCSPCYDGDHDACQGPVYDPDLGDVPCACTHAPVLQSVVARQHREARGNVPHDETDAFEHLVRAGDALNRAQDRRGSRALSIAKQYLDTTMLWVEADLKLKHRALGTELPPVL